MPNQIAEHSTKIVARTDAKGLSEKLHRERAVWRELFLRRESHVLQRPKPFRPNDLFVKNGTEQVVQALPLETRETYLAERFYRPTKDSRQVLARMQDGDIIAAKKLLATAAAKGTETMRELLGGLKSDLMLNGAVLGPIHCDADGLQTSIYRPGNWSALSIHITNDGEVLIQPFSPAGRKPFDHAQTLLKRCATRQPLSKLETMCAEWDLAIALLSRNQQFKPGKRVEESPEALGTVAAAILQTAYHDGITDGNGNLLRTDEAIAYLQKKVNDVPTLKANNIEILLDSDGKTILATTRVNKKYDLKVAFNLKRVPTVGQKVLANERSNRAC